MIAVHFVCFFLGAGNDQNARAGGGEGSGEVWRVWRVDKKEGDGEGETGRGATGRGDWEGTMGRGRRATGGGRRGGLQ